MSLSVVQVIGNVAVGGAESHMLDLVEGLLERGHEVRVVCPRPGPLSAALERRGILVNYLDMVAPRPDDDYAIDWGVLAQLTRWLDDWQPQVVHSHLYPAHVHATLAAAHVGVPAIVYTAHTLVVRSGDVLLARLTPVRTIATSRRVADLLMEAGLSSERLEVVYNGCRREHFGDAHKAVRRARAALHLGDGPVVGTVARLSAEKGVDVLLTALGHVVEQVPSVTALIVGDGPRLVELREQTGRLGLNGHVRFLGARSDVAVLNRLMDVFVLPSRQEACPMALLEAMAAGRAIVATDVGGNRELIENARTGVLVPSEQPATLARQIVTALSHPRRRKKMGRAARARVGALFTRERMVTRTCAVYRRMLAARS